MPDQPTVFCTTNDAILHRTLDTHFPAFRCLTYDKGVPDLKSTGRIWCFIDWLLPDIAGQELCRQLRQTMPWQNAHITMILEDNDDDTRRRALRAGADDYLQGPLTADTLVERLSHYTQRVPSQISQNAASNGDLEIDPAAFLVRYRGKRLGLPPNEFRLLAHFVEHPDRVFTRSSLIDMVGKQSATIDDRTVDVWVGRLRKALKLHGVPDPIRAVRSVGYVFDGVEQG